MDKDGRAAVRRPAGSARVAEGDSLAKVAGVLPKPFTIAVLRQAVDSALLASAD